MRGLKIGIYVIYHTANLVAGFTWERSLVDQFLGEFLFWGVDMFNRRISNIPGFDLSRLRPCLVVVTGCSSGSSTVVAWDPITSDLLSIA